MLLVRRAGRVTLAVPGRDFAAELVLDALARLARAVGADPDRYAALLRLGVGSTGRDPAPIVSPACRPPRDRAAHQPHRRPRPGDPGPGHGAAPAPRRRASRCAPCRAATPTRPSTWPDSASPTASSRCWCAAATGSSTWGCRRSPAPTPPWASCRPAPATTWPATSTCRARTRSRRPTGSSPAATRRIDLARSGSKYFVTVLAAGFDAIVNERANQMTWPKGQMRYNIATLAELRTFTPLHYTLELDGQARELEAMMVAVGNGPSFGGGLRITEGAVLDDGLLDVVLFKPMSRARAWCGPTPSCSRAPTPRHPQYEHHRVPRVTVASPGIVAYADGERFGELPLTVECVPGRADGGDVSTLDGHPALTDFRARATPSRSTTFQVRACRAIEEGRGVLVAAPTGSGKTIVGEFAVHLALPTGRKCFYTTPIKALSNQKYADLVAALRRRSNVGLLTGDNSVNGEAPVVVMTTEVLRNMLYAGSRHPARPRLRGDGRGALPRRPDARRGVGGGDHPPARVGGRWSRCRPPSPTPRSSASGWRRCAATPPPSWRRGDRCPLFQHVMVGKRMLGPVRLLRRRRRGRVRPRGRPGQRAAGAHRPRRLGQQPADAGPALAAQGPAGVDRRTRAASATAAGCGSPAGST